MTVAWNVHQFSPHLSAPWTSFSIMPHENKEDIRVRCFPVCFLCYQTVSFKSYGELFLLLAPYYQRRQCYT